MRGAVLFRTVGTGNAGIEHLLSEDEWQTG